MLVFKDVTINIEVVASLGFWIIVIKLHRGEFPIDLGHLLRIIEGYQQN